MEPDIKYCIPDAQFEQDVNRLIADAVEPLQAEINRLWDRLAVLNEDLIERGIIPENRP